MTGQTIAHYKILEQLGAGGMGIVYKALDTHLDRFVAIKVLPPEKVADAERKRRFVQEAKAASALNHPNIITIHDIASENGIDFIVMEFVPGKALNQLIGRKRLPLSEALRYAIQIADALAAAHSAGIIHRDLKPGNVMVGGPEGRPAAVKVLDFGLAKLTDKPESGEREFTETIRQDDAPGTDEGTIVGTVSYMSPEQAEGKKVDARSDIFSFGTLLYEMVTGQRAFQRDSKLATLSAILREEPKPASQVVEELPRELERIIARCLRKSPERRFQAMPDLKVALEELKEESDSGTLMRAAPESRSGRRRWLIGAAVVVTASGAGALWFVRSTTNAPEAVLHAVPLTTYPGFQEQPTFSPDGNQVAFSWNGEKRDNQDIYVKLIGTGGPPLRLTTHQAADNNPAWSPDGRFIAFLRELAEEKAEVLLIPALGGPEHKVAEILTGGRFLLSPYLTWAPDGKSLVISAKDSPTGPAGLFLLSVETGEKRRLTAPPESVRGDSCPAISSDGRSLAFTRTPDAGVGDLFVMALSGELKPVGEARRLTLANQGYGKPAWSADDREIVFSGASGHLWKISTSGSAQPQRLTSLGENTEQPAISPRARRLALVHHFTHSNIWRMAAPGSRDSASLKTLPPGGGATPFISSTRSEFSPQFSPDGKKIAFMSTRSGVREIWIADEQGANPVQLTDFAGADVSEGRWSADSSRLAFDSNATGAFDVWIVNANGGKPQRMTTHPGNDGNPSWSRDGQWLYFDSARMGEQQVFKMPANGGEAIQITHDGAWAPVESPDGKFLYYTKSLINTSVWRIPVAGGQTTKVLDSLAGFQELAVVDDGLYFVPEQNGTARSSIQFLRFATRKAELVATFEKPVGAGLAVSPDGRTILYTQIEQAGSELMLVENFR